MTVIAYKNGIIAADSMWSDDSVVGFLPSKHGKIVTTHGGLGAIGVCGNHGWTSLVARTWERKSNPLDIIGTKDLMKALENPDWAALLVFDQRVIYADSQCPPHFMDSVVAIGSGSNLAIGAMAAGAGAIEAARIAAKHSNTCGGKIIYREIPRCSKKLLKKKRS